MIKREKLLSLVTKAQQGDPDAMNELISECYKGLYYFALKTVGDAELAADATQDACMEIFSTIGNLREPLGFINWARRIVYHRCLRNKKIETRLPTVQEDEDFPIADRAFDENATASPEELYEHQELCETVRTLLESLPEEQRAALLLYYHENLSVKEIAEIQSISEGTVKSRLNYGRQSVKKKVEEYEERTGTKLHAILPLPLLLFRVFEQAAQELSTLPILPDASSLLAEATAAEAAMGSTAVGATAASETAVGGIGASAASETAVGGIGASAASETAVGGIGASAASETAVGGIGASAASETAVGAIGVAVAGETAVGAVGVAAAAGAATKAIGLSVVAKVVLGLLAAAVVAGSAIGIGTLTGDRSSDDDGSETVAQGGNGTDHVHLYDGAYQTNASHHWQICECGAPSEKTEHTYGGNVCTLCGMKTASEGLYMIKKEDHYLVGGIGTCTDTDIVFPSEYNGLPVKGFDGWAMQSNTSAVSVVIPSTYTSIGDRVFWNCSALRKVTLPEELIYLSEYAFWDCTLLTEINIPENVTRLPHFTFSGCTSLTSIDLPDRLSEIGTGAFNRCTALTEITIPAGVTRISASAFNRCTSLRDVYFLGTVAEWNAIDRSETSFEANNMALEGMNFTVHCVDGDVR